MANVRPIITVCLYLLFLLGAGSEVKASTDACTDLPSTGILCRIVAAEPGEFLPPRAIGAISAFVATKIKGDNPSTGALELGLFSLLPPDVQSRCVTAASGADTSKLGVALLCLRPACLDASPVDLCTPILRSISPTDIEALRTARLKALKACSKIETCILSPEAIELVVAADELRSFLTGRITAANWTAFCPESRVPECSRRLFDFANRLLGQYSASATWHTVISQLKASKGLVSSTFLTHPDVVRLEGAWDRIQKAIDKAQGGSTSNELFALVPEVQTEILATAEITSSVSALVNSLVDDERLRTATEAMNDLRTFFASIDTGVVVDENLKAQFQKLSTSPLSKSDPNWRQTISSIRDLASKVQAVQQQLVAKVQSKPFSIDDHACVSGKGRFDASTGLLELCYSQSSAQLQIAGLRFNFAPCPAPNQTCATRGDVQILRKLGGAPRVSR